MGQDADGKPLWMEHKSPIGVKTEPQGCPSNPKLNQFVLDSLEWVFHEIPELGGIQMESGHANARAARSAVPNVTRMS